MEECSSRRSSQKAVRMFDGSASEAFLFPLRFFQSSRRSRHGGCGRRQRLGADPRSFSFLTSFSFVPFLFIILIYGLLFILSNNPIN